MSERGMDVDDVDELAIDEPEGRVVGDAYGILFIPGPEEHGGWAEKTPGSGPDYRRPCASESWAARRLPTYERLGRLLRALTWIKAPNLPSFILGTISGGCGDGGREVFVNTAGSETRRRKTTCAP